jgi:hypothetical protein
MLPAVVGLCRAIRSNRQLRHNFLKHALAYLGTLAVILLGCALVWGRVPS